MRLFRDDLVIMPAEDGPGCQVRDDATGEIYEFGAVERFLIERFSQPYKLDQVCADCNARFDLHYTVQDLGEFLVMLDNWGLLEVPVGTAPTADLDVACQATTEETPATTYTSDLKQPNRWHLFHPQAMFDHLNRLLRPFRFMVWLTPVVFVLGGIAVMFSLDALGNSLSKASSAFGLFGRLLFATLTVNLASQVARGLVARMHGLATPSFGILLMFGLLPRFNVQIVAGGSNLSRSSRMWLSATATLLRLWLIGIATLTWAMTRTSGSLLPIISIELALISIVSLMFVANPLWRGDGANFLSAWLDTPNIQRRARSAMLSFFTRQPEVIRRHAKYSLGLGLIGLASVTLFLTVLGFVVFKVFGYLESHYQGAGVTLFLALAAYVSLTVRRQQNAKKARAAAARVVNGGTSLVGADQPPSRSVGQLSGSRLPSASRPWLKYGVLIMLIAALFLPYRYETGGDAEILPTARVNVAAEIDGIIESVNFDGGEWVKAGEVLARMADYKQLSELHQLESSIEATRYEIEKYRTTPSREEIRLAEEKLAAARLQARYSIEKLKRQEQLFGQNFISQQSLEDARNVAERDHQAEIQAEASLKALMVQINPNQIASLQATVTKLQKEADLYREQLRRTQMRTPIEGRIVTKDLQFLRNSYLEAGKTFAQIEDSRNVLLRVAVPEFDIGDVTLGAPVILRLWAYPDREFTGTVNEIQPTTEELEFGRVVYVTSLVDNADGALRTGLTGQAKIPGNKTIVMLAFTRALYRFVVVEVWSWLP